MMKKGRYTALEVAKYLIKLGLEDIGDDKGEFYGPGITHLKLQKLLFFSQVYYIVEHNKPLFGEEIVAWKYGPVVENIWDEFKDSKTDPLEDWGGEITISHADQDILQEKVWRIFGGFTAGALVEMTHAHQPWKDAYANTTKTITHNSIKSYYSSLIWG